VLDFFFILLPLKVGLLILYEVHLLLGDFCLISELFKRFLSKINDVLQIFVFYFEANQTLLSSE
jgi:hypothetical protein